MPHQAIEHIQRRLSHDISVKFDRMYPNWGYPRHGVWPKGEYGWGPDVSGP